MEVEHEGGGGGGAAAAATAWLRSAGPPPRRVSFRRALNPGMATTPTSQQHSPSLHSPSPANLKPLNSSLLMAGKGAHCRAGPSSGPMVASPAHEPLSWTPASRIGAGLSNLGNTCFLNSVLQCLTYTPPLAGYLDSGEHKTTCRAAGFCAMCALQEHVRRALSASGGAVSPSNLVKNLRCISKSFRVWRQEDAHEYLRCLIEGLHNCCLPPEVKSNSSVSQERSLIHKIFGGRLRSQVKCTVCSTCSNTYDPLLDLSLEIVRADSLTKALNRFTAVEALEGDNKYHCSHCRKKVRALKQFTIDKSPNILTIQFKRFSGTGSSGGKIDKKIEFGRTLDMKPYISNPQITDAKYSLYAVLVHAGWSTHSGHYFCFVRTKGDMWHALDDSRVKQVSEKYVLDQKAYILFYIKDSVTQSSAGTEQLLRNSLPALKKLLSDGAGETADDSSSADDFDHHGRQVSNAQSSQRAAKSNSSLPVRPAGNSQSSLRNDTGDTQGGASNLTGETDVPVLETNGVPVGVKLKDDSVEANPVANGAIVNDKIQPKAEALPGITENSEPETTSMRSDLSSESPAASTAATVEAEAGKKSDSNVEADCSTSGEDDDEDDTDWDEYHKHFCNTPQRYMRLLYVMPHTRRYFMARSHLRQRDRKRSACRKGHCPFENEEKTNGVGSHCGKTSKRLSCAAGEGNSASAKKQKLGNGLEESCNGDAPASEHIIVLRERLQSNGTCHAGESVLRVTKGDAQPGDDRLFGAAGHTENGACANGSSHGAPSSFADVLEHPERRDGSRIAEREVDRDRYSKAAVNASMNSSYSQSNGLYDFEVPRWDEAEANGNGFIRDIDRLLRTHKTVVPQQDSWDEEYDRGNLKKVRNKEKLTGLEVNPFQAMANNSKQRLSSEVGSRNVAN